MNRNLIFVLIFSAFILSSGCASQEDMLYADLWSGDPSIYVYEEGNDVRDLGKTPRNKMLEQRREDERKSNRSTEENLIDYFLFDPEKLRHGTSGEIIIRRR